MAWFLIPALALFVFAVLWPSARGLRYAFTDWNGLTPPHWVGFANFREMFSDPQASAAVAHTAVIAVAFPILVNLIGLAIALAVESNRRLASLAKTLIFLPAILTPIVTAYLWQFILSPDGSLNRLLASVHLGGLAKPWLGEGRLALGAVIVVLVWQSVGITMVVYVAGLKGVSEELREAAMLDGASAGRRLWHVVLPQLTPAMTVNILLTVIVGLRVFDQILVLTGGGPGFSTQTLSTLVYYRAFQQGQMGYSAAMAVVLTGFVTLVAGLVYLPLSKRARA